MSSLFVDLLPSAIGLAVTPGAIAACILMLSVTTRPVANASAYAGAFALAYTAYSILILAMTGAASGPIIDQNIKNWIVFFVGILLLAMAAILYFRPPGEKAATTLVNAIEKINPAEAFVLGLFMAIFNANIPILTAGLGIIVAADVTVATRYLGALFLVLASQIGISGPILWYVTEPESAASGLEKIKIWLVKHEVAVNLTVLSVFGLLFTIRGWTGI